MIILKIIYLLIIIILVFYFINKYIFNENFRNLNTRKLCINKFLNNKNNYKNKNIKNIISNEINNNDSNNNYINNKILIPNIKKDLSFTFFKNNIKFYSSNFCIIPHNDSGYFINFSCVNYRINSNNHYSYSINKFMHVDKNFNLLEEKNFINNEDSIGIEDIRIFNYKNIIIFIGITNHSNDNIGIVIGKYNFNKNFLEYNEIETTFSNNKIEKNWVYFIIDDELYLIYKWYPLQICKCNDEIFFSNYSKNDKIRINLLKEIQMPLIFKNIRGSTCGFNYNNEIWFITHTQDRNPEVSYYHNFVVFDNNMNLIKYSNSFKFEGYLIEFCLGLIITDDEFIISYSILDNYSKIGVYKRTNILNEIDWTII